MLLELGKKLDVKAFNFKRQYPDFLFPGKTQFVSADDEAIPVESTSILDSINPFSYIRTVREIEKWKPDLVIVRYWMSFFAPSLGFVTRRLRKKGIKVISILDNVIPHERHFFDLPLTKYFLGGSNGCVTLCEAVRGELKEINPTIPCKVIFHPLYSHFPSPTPRDKAILDLGLDPKRKTLLFFGLIREYKGLDILLEAFNLLGKDYQLIIAGEPYGSFEPYQKIIDEYGLQDRVHLSLSYIKDSQVGAYFSAADLSVLPYRSATQSGVSSISFHYEVPMVTTDVGGLRETIADTGTGLVCRECTPESVREGIISYFSNPDFALECKQNIRIQKQALSWESFAKSLLDFAKTL